MSMSDTKPFRIYLCGHSVGLARGDWHGSHAVPWDDTYTQLLFGRMRKLEAEKGLRIDYLPNSKRNRIMADVASMMWELVLFKPDLFIIDAGIGDCAPRVFSNWQRAIVSWLPSPLRNAVLAFVKKQRRRIIQTMPLKVWTKPDVFERHCRDIAEALVEKGIGFGFLSIAPTGSILSHRSPGYFEQVIKYNRIVKRVAAECGGSYIDTHTQLLDPSPDEYMLDDGHHFDVKGHRLCADALEDWLRQTIPDGPKRQA